MSFNIFSTGTKYVGDMCSGSYNIVVTATFYFSCYTLEWIIAQLRWKQHMIGLRNSASDVCNLFILRLYCLK